MNIDSGFISALLSSKDPQEIRRVDKSWLVPEYQAPLDFIVEFLKKHQRLPLAKTILAKFKGTGIKYTKNPELPRFYADEIRERALRAYYVERLKGEVAPSLESGESAKAETAILSLVAEARRKFRIETADIGIESDGTKDRWAAYLERKEKKGLIGLPYPWASFNEATMGMMAGDLITFVARAKKKKCVEASTPIMDPVTGLIRGIKDVVERRGKVHTLADSAKLVAVMPSAHIYTGKKECLRMVGGTGRVLVGTPEHPVLTPVGYRDLSDLRIGDWVASARRVPEPSHPVSMPDWEVDLLGVMLAEGSTAGHHISFSSEDLEIVNRTRTAARQLHSLVTWSSAYDYAITCAYDSHGVKTPMREWCEKHGLYGVLAKEKKMPDAVFRLSVPQLRRFLSVFMACDGHICSKTGRVGVGLASESLIDSLQHLFLRCGVSTYKSFREITRDGKKFNAWALMVYTDSMEAYREIGFALKRKQDVLDSMEYTELKTGGVPVAPIKERVIEALRALPRQQRWEIAEAAGMSRGSLDPTHITKPKTIRRDVFRAIVAACPELADLAWLASDDVRFEEVVELSAVGVRRVYDLTVPDTHNFLANNFIVHNTWVAMVLLDHLVNLGYDVLLHSMEWQPSRLKMRTDAIGARVSAYRLRSGQLTPKEEKRYQRFLKSVRTGKPFKPNKIPRGRYHFYGKQAIRTPLQLSIAIQQTRPAVVVSDSAYLMGKTRKWEDQAALQSDLKDIAGTHELPLIQTWQFNRGVKGDQKGGADQTEVGGTDAVVQDGDCIFSIFQTEEDAEDNILNIEDIAIRDGIGLGRRTIQMDLEKMQFAEVASMGGYDDKPVEYELDDDE